MKLRRSGYAMLSKILSVAAILALAPAALAQNSASGTRDGGGGNASCAEFSDTVGEIALAFKMLGQEKVTPVNSEVNVEQLWKIKRNPLKCLPVESLDRQARSSRATVTTELLWKEWNKLNEYEKFRLAIHELAVLADYEGDGEYFMSKTMVEILQKFSPKYADLVRKQNARAEEIVQNVDGTTTFIKPYVRAKDGRVYPIAIFRDEQSKPKKDATAACLYFGYQRAVSSWNEVGDDVAVLAVLTASGALDTYEKQSYLYNRDRITSLICAPFEKTGDKPVCSSK